MNMKQRKECVSPGEKPKPRIKKDLHSMKTMIWVWWDSDGLIYWEMLGKNMKIENNLYKAQLHRINEAIQQKR